MDSRTLIIVITIIIILIAVGAAHYFAGQIVKPSREAREVAETEKIESAEPEDIWQGFVKAHDQNPPKFAENDSWG